MKLVMIHGRAQQEKDPRVLQAEWEYALDRGFKAAGLARPKGLESVMPYYGDTLVDLIRELDTPLVDDAVTKGDAWEAKGMAFQGELLQELAEDYGITKEEILAHYDGDPREKGPLNWKWVRALLQALDRTDLGSAALDAFTRDVYVYLSYPAIRKKIDAIVSEVLPTEPCVVLGHSLGSVVGYNVLSDAPAATRVVSYVTVGSPLGVKAVRRLLRSPLAMPGTTSSWFNAYDPRDIVSLNALDHATFPITPDIKNKHDVDNDTDNRHGISGYLKDKDVARWLHRAVTASES